MIVSLERKGIARRIERGDYEVDAYKVADAILRRPELARVLSGSMLEAGRVDGSTVVPSDHPNPGLDAA